MDLYIVIILLITGFVAGGVSGMFGSGGGIVMFIIFFHIFPMLGFHGKELIYSIFTTSFACAIPVFVISAYTHYKSKKYEPRIVKILILPSIAGLIASFFMVIVCPIVVIKIIFICFVFMTALYLGIKEKLNFYYPLPSENKLRVIGFFSELITGSLSVAIGGIFTSLLVLWKIPINKAIATSALIGVYTMVLGAAFYILKGYFSVGFHGWNFGYLNLYAFIFIFAGSVIGSFFGSKLVHIIPHKILNMMYVAIMICVGVDMLLSVLSFS